MAKNTYWLVGVGGSGKTTMAVALAAMYSRRPGIVCGLKTEFGMVCRYDASAGDFADDVNAPDLLDSADVLFIEVQPRHFDPDMPRAGDVVVRMEKVPRPAWDGVFRLQDFVGPAPAHQAQAAINSDAEQGAAHA